MKLRPWKNLEKKMKRGPSICGIAHNQIRQRRISSVPLGTQKNVYGFLHTRSFLQRWLRRATRVVLVGHFVPALALRLG